MISVFLVRHGQSQANAGVATADPVKVQLTLLGKEQAVDIADYFKTHTPPKLIVTSPYKRTKQTAVPSRELFPRTVAEEWEVQEFTYLSSIHRVCSTVQDRKPLVDGYWMKSEPSIWDDFYNTFMSDTHSEVPAIAARAGITADFYRTCMISSHSESFKVFIWRVQAFIRKLKELDDRYQNIAVFSHEQFIAAVLWCIMRKPEEINPIAMGEFRQFFYDNRVPNGGIVKLKVMRSHDVWHSELITSHLQHAASGQEPVPKEERELASVY